MKPRFSDRIGVTRVPNVLQTESMSDALRNSLWNCLDSTILHVRNNDALALAVHTICAKFYKLPADILPLYRHRKIEWFRDKFFDPGFQWYQLYNLIEFVVDNYYFFMSASNLNAFKAEINEVLEEEMSGYRFIGDVLSPITSPDEIKSVSSAIEAANANELFGTKKHLEAAIVLISQKPTSDYRNSIKESISAIESLAKQLTGEAGGGLEKALSKLDSAVKFHGAFKAGLLSLYGYTSDEDGIRHAILEEKDIGFDEAKFMLVTCSALINFIISKANKNGLL